MLYNIDILFNYQIPTYKPSKQVSKIATLVSHLLPLQLCDTKVPFPEKLWCHTGQASGTPNFFRETNPYYKKPFKPLNLEFLWVKLHQNFCTYYGDHT